MCEYTTFTTTNEVILDEPSNSIPYTDTSKYEWKPDNICEVGVVITCEKSYGTPIDCNSTPPAKTTDDCTVDVKYMYTVTNFGPTTENINIFSRILNGNVKDFTYALDTT